jgi:hypothetical protein
MPPRIIHVTNRPQEKSTVYTLLDHILHEDNNVPIINNWWAHQVFGMATEGDIFVIDEQLHNFDDGVTLAKMLQEQGYLVIIIDYRNARARFPEVQIQMVAGPKHGQWNETAAQELQAFVLEAVRKIKTQI